MLDKYKSQYRRFKKALEWFDRADISQEEKEKLMPTFAELIKELAELHQELRRPGYGRGIKADRGRDRQ